jgi:chaperonin cofactor prefoldin
MAPSESDSEDCLDCRMENVITVMSDACEIYRWWIERLNKQLAQARAEIKSLKAELQSQRNTS